MYEDNVLYLLSIIVYVCHALIDFDGRCGGYCSDGVYILVE